MISNDYKNKADSLLFIIENDTNLNYNFIPKLCLQGIEYANKINNINLKGKFYYYSAYYNHQAGAYPKSYDDLVHALKCFEEVKDSIEIAKVYRLFGESNRATGSFTRALNYLDKAAILSEKLNLKYELAQVYNRKAAVFYENKQIDSVPIYVMKSISLLNNDDQFSRLIANNYNILGALYMTILPDSAMVYYTKAFEAIENNVFYADKANILANLSRLQFFNKDFERAIPNAMQSYKIAEQYGISSYILSSSKTLSDLYAEIKMYDSAHKYLYIFNELRDSLFSSQSTQRIIDLERLFEEERLMQEVNHEKEINYYRLLFLGAIILFISIIFIIFLVRSREMFRRNKDLEETNLTIRNQAEELVLLNNNKDFLFSIIAHDLKNPLSSMQMIAKIFVDEFYNLSDEDKVEFINDIISATKSANLLLDSLLVWSRSQRNLIQVHNEEVIPFEIINQIIAIFEPHSSSKNIKISNNILQDFTFITDSNMLSTILRNIISNAVKFTHIGGKVDVSLIIDSSNPDFITFEIIDTGIGISDELMNNLFIPGNRNPSLGTQNEQGSGLGLLICKDFCDNIGGSIYVESNQNKGTTFKVKLPVVPSTISNS